MKAIGLHAQGGPESFIYEEGPRPEPGTGEVLIRVHAAAVTPSELQWVPTFTTPTGGPRAFPIILGHEFSGVVEAVGPDVTPALAGQSVYGINDWFRDGAQAEYCVARAVEVAAKPRSIDHVQAASIPISALTAWQGLISRARLAEGQRVLIHGGSGGVGLFAVQLARRCGAHVIGTASAGNLDFVRGLGADEVVDYRAQRFEELVGKVDVVFDTVGGETLARSWAVLKPGGTMVTIAASEERIEDARIRDAFFIVEANREQLTEIARLVDAGELRVVVGAVFSLADARQAYEQKPARGKTVLRVEE